LPDEVKPPPGVVPEAKFLSLDAPQSPVADQPANTSFSCRSSLCRSSWVSVVGLELSVLVRTHQSTEIHPDVPISAGHSNSLPKDAWEWHAGRGKEGLMAVLIWLIYVAQARGACCVCTCLKISILSAIAGPPPIRLAMAR
jgi:hypothetical protein